MKDNITECLKALLKHEGGYVNNPKDPGGMTNLGVTKRVWEEWVGRTVDEAEMRALTPALVEPLYKQKYWDAIKGDDLPSGVDMTVFDCCVNSGAGRATKIAQKVVGVTQDGGFGPKTLAAILEFCEQHGEDQFIADYNSERLNFLKALPTFEHFGKGWSRRVNEVIVASDELARNEA